MDSLLDSECPKYLCQLPPQRLHFHVQNIDFRGPYVHVHFFRVFSMFVFVRGLRCFSAVVLRVAFRKLRAQLNSFWSLQQDGIGAMRIYATVRVALLRVDPT